MLPEVLVIDRCHRVEPILLGFAAFSWFFCISVFSHPEKPMHYELLGRFDKLEKIRRFTDADAPTGKAFTRMDLRETFGADAA